MADSNPELGGMKAEVVAAVRAVLDEDARVYTIEPSSNTFVMEFEASGQYSIRVSVASGDNYLSIHGALPFVVPAEKAADLLAIANELNVETPVGCFEFHPVPRRFIFKYGLVIPPMPLAEQIRSMLACAVSYADYAAARVTAAL